MRNLVFVALLATAALSLGCNGIHKRNGGCGGGGCGNGGCGGQAGPCGPGGCAGGGYAGGAYGGGQGGCDACAAGGHSGGQAGGPGGGQHGMPGVPHHFSREYQGPQGPPSAQVAYPYYTTRGPRDYFANEPWSIGK